MERHGSLIQLKPEWEERYIILHKHIFPEVLAQIARSKITNYTIFLRERVLFGYFEYIGEDYEADMAAMAADPVTQEWWKLTDPAQLPLPTAGPDEWWTPTEEVFHYEGIAPVVIPRTRYAHVVGIKPDAESEYIRIHAEVPPVVLQQLDRSNVSNYTVFLRDSRLYSYYEYSGNDHAEDMLAMSDDQETRKWWQATMAVQIPIPSADEYWWAPMLEVFHAD